jgi:hypothetical protein
MRRWKIIVLVGVGLLVPAASCTFIGSHGIGDRDPCSQERGE